MVVFRFLSFAALKYVAFRTNEVSPPAQTYLHTESFTVPPIPSPVHLPCDVAKIDVILLN